MYLPLFPTLKTTNLNSVDDVIYAMSFETAYFLITDHQENPNPSPELPKAFRQVQTTEKLFDRTPYVNGDTQVLVSYPTLETLQIV
jgi:hypothetical protein